MNLIGFAAWPCLAHKPKELRGSDSDIDLLVDFEPGGVPGSLGRPLEDELALAGGRKWICVHQVICHDTSDEVVHSPSAICALKTAFACYTYQRRLRPR